MRGKNTTRETALFPCVNGGYLVDTPGFTFVPLPEICAGDLQLYQTAETAKGDIPDRSQHHDVDGHALDRCHQCL